MLIRSPFDKNREVVPAFLVIDLEKTRLSPTRPNTFGERHGGCGMDAILFFCFDGATNKLLLARSHHVRTIRTQRAAGTAAATPTTGPQRRCRQK